MEDLRAVVSQVVMLLYRCQDEALAVGPERLRERQRRLLAMGAREMKRALSIALRADFLSIDNPFFQAPPPAPRAPIAQKKMHKVRVAVEG